MHAHLSFSFNNEFIRILIFKILSILKYLLNVQYRWGVLIQNTELCVFTGDSVSRYHYKNLKNLKILWSLGIFKNSKSQISNNCIVEQKRWWCP